MPNQHTSRDEVSELSFGKPHVVILGAGASRAATPNGDANGYRLPVMADFVDAVELAPILKTHGIKYEDEENFEVVYSKLSSGGVHREALQEIEVKVRDYFSTLSLPQIPTVYDHLILSLRKKDLIATFNWDPFLYQACYRNRQIAELPHVVYLHGNVATGYCLEHQKKGPPNSFCSICGLPFIPSRLIYPVTQKNYNNDTFLTAEWATLKMYLKNAYLLTIFGYGAPSSDLEAFQLMKEGWGNVNDRALEQTEIIDIRDREELSRLWSPFIHTHHYEIHSSFEESWLAKHPRRTCESAWKQFMECQYLEEHKYPANASFEELYQWIRPLTEAEKKAR